MFSCTVKMQSMLSYWPQNRKHKKINIKLRQFTFSPKQEKTFKIALKVQTFSEPFYVKWSFCVMFVHCQQVYLYSSQVQFQFIDYDQILLFYNVAVFINIYLNVVNTTGRLKIKDKSKKSSACSLEMFNILML